VVTDELAAEQAYVDLAYASLGAMRARTVDIFERLMATGGFVDLDHEVAVRRRIAALGDSPRPLLFGRIDEVTSERWYVGRRHVETERGDPVVIEWRTPVAEAFYRARPGEPHGLVSRRQLVVEQRRLVSLADDVFSGEPAAGAATDGDTGVVHLRGGDALLAELERSRTGEMLDIVATIQLEQDEVIRAPLAGVRAVQGGPGSGKTAIGLHRAAYLLFNHPELARAEVLVVGPSRTFLGYIAQVLPSLGEEAVVQVTLDDLVPQIEVRAVDGEDAQRVKGDARMATVIARALEQRRAVAGDDLTVRVGPRRVVLAREQVDDVVREVAARALPYRAARAALRARLARALARAAGALDAVDPRAIGADPAFRAALDEVWPSVSPATLVADLVGSRARLGRAAAGVLDESEQAAILRPAARSRSRVAWAPGDRALVDEARDLIDGHTSTYGHVVVDEAQDLSPMELRMIARRAPRGSVTLLGDLAQATAVWSHRSWDDVVAHLPAPDGRDVHELRLGYRAPAAVVELAARLLPEAAPTVAPMRSVRPGTRPPRVLHADAGALYGRAAAEAGELAAEGFLVGCIVAPDAVGAAARALDAHDVPHGVAARDGLGRRVTLLSAPEAKGLEFDAVVVVEPAAIAGGTVRGLRLLYVALTRPIQHLSIVHSAPLPAALRAPAPATRRPAAARAR
jgi:DNA helicase IV